MALWVPKDGGPLSSRDLLFFLSSTLLLLSYPSSYPCFLISLSSSPTFIPLITLTLIFVTSSFLPLLFTAPPLYSLLCPHPLIPLLFLTLHHSPSLHTFASLTLHLLFFCSFSRVYSHHHHFLPSNSLLFLTYSYLLSPSPTLFYTLAPFLPIHLSLTLPLIFT